jgi:hypothetical protein
MAAAACRREGAMSKRGLKGAAVGVSALALVAVGAHFAWEWHRVRLHTPKGTIHIGMTRAEVKSVAGPNCLYYGCSLAAKTTYCFFDRDVTAWVKADFDQDERVERASTPDSSIPRPSLFEHVRSWLGGKREEK